MQRPTSEHGLGRADHPIPRPATPEYDAIPALSDVIIPFAGVEYAWVLPESIAAAQQDYNRDGLHYTQIPGLPLLLVCGIPLALMGRGKAILGAPPEVSACPTFIDENAAIRIDQARKAKDLPPLYTDYYPPTELPTAKTSTAKE